MRYKAVGIMSGTSLDGLDMAYCEFEKQNGHWTYSIGCAETAEYPQELRDRIIAMETASAEELCRFDAELGRYFGSLTKDFIERNRISPDFVCSHGQTIFHQPSQGFTTQIGSLAQICAQVRRTTVGDFRSLDVSLAGQGAPLVPIGDLHLFADYSDCLNIGGFANISHKESGGIKAYDICPANIVLNLLCGKIGLGYDDGGKIARENQIDETLLQKLNSLPYYEEKHSASSLGKEWVKENVFPLLASSGLSTERQIATYTFHAAEQISKNIKGSCLVSGGGAYNSHLMDLIRQNTPYSVQIADPTTINYKEALIFAFLGVLRLRGEANCLSSVTGARQSCCSGAVLQWI